MFSNDWLEWSVEFAYGGSRLAIELLLQSTALIALGLLAGWLVRSKGAAVQSATYRATLVAVLACPVVSLLIRAAGIDGLALSLPAPALRVQDLTDARDLTGAGREQRVEALPVAVSSPTGDLLVAEGPANSGLAHGGLPSDLVRSIADRSPASGDVTTAGPSSLSTVRLTGTAILACVVTATWLTVSTVLFLRLGASCVGLRRLRRRARQAEPATTTECRALAARMGIRAPAVLRSRRVGSPCLVGFLHPAILLPEAGEGERSAAGEILAHELAHLARHDCIWNLLCRAGRALLFFQPLLWTLTRRTVRAAEEVCDDYVIALGFEAADYAQRLTEVAERFRPPVAAAAVAIVSLRSWLGRRVVRILDSSRSRSTRTGLRALIALTLVGVVSTALVGMVGVGTGHAAGAPDPEASGAGQRAGGAEQRQKSLEAHDRHGEQKKTEADVVKISASGKVVDGEGNPIAEANVYLREWVSYRFSEDPYHQDPDDLLAKMQTGANGTFRIDDFPAQRFGQAWDLKAPWDVVVIAPGFAMAWRHLRTAQDETPMTLTLPSELKVTGRIVDQRDEPIAGVEVKVGQLADLASDVRGERASPGRLSLWGSRLAPKVETDADGRFTIGGLPPEKRVLLIAKHDQYARTPCYAATTDRPQPDLVDVSYDGHERRETKHTVHTGEFTLRLAPGYCVLGRALFADTQRPCAQAKVMLYWENRAHHAFADAEGRFTFPSLADPEWYVSVSPGEKSLYLTRRIRAPSLSEDNRTVEVEVELPRGDEITGSVVAQGTGEGVPGVRVYWNQHLPDDAPEAVFGTPATTDENGRFRVVAPAGAGDLIISGPVEGYDLPAWRRPSEEPDRRYVRTIQVKRGEPVRDVRFTVDQGLLIQGRVTDPEGKPVAGAEVNTRSRPRQRIKQASAQTDEQGRFTLAGFPPTEGLDLEIKHRPRKLIGEATVEADGQAGATRIVSVDCQLQQAATVKGRVLVDGEPMAGFRVPLLEMRTFNGVTAGMPVDHAMTDDAGRFQFDTAPPGRQCHVYSFSDEFTGLSSPTFQLEPGQTHDLGTFELWTKSMSVAGIVVDPDGNPVEGVTVGARQREGRSPGGGGTTRQPTGKDGRFTIRGVPNMPLSVSAYVLEPADPELDYRKVRFAATVDAMPGETDVRIVLDPKLQRSRPERIEPVRRD